MISCQTTNVGQERDTKEFLVTDNLALKSWLNKRFSIAYESATPQLIFEQEPFKEVKIRYSNLPADAPPFSFTSGGLSRRELLKEIANFWNLEMTIHTNSEGQPTFISATGKAEPGENSAASATS